MDGDLNRVRGIAEPTAFVTVLEELMGNELTNDYWTISLPAALESSSARNPELFAYVAAQNRLGAPVLFSHKRVGDLIDPVLRTKKKPLERHHLFPRAWQEAQGQTDLKVINQMANFALLEWPDNIAIGGDEAPSEYVPKLRTRFTAIEWLRMQDLHALPEGWELLAYPDFLAARRQLMAGVIRRGFESL